MSSEVKDRFVTIRLSSELYEALKALCRLEGKSLQEVSREALAKAVVSSLRIPEATATGAGVPERSESDG